MTPKHKPQPDLPWEGPEHLEAELIGSEGTTEYRFASSPEDVWPGSSAPLGKRGVWRGCTAEGAVWLDLTLAEARKEIAYLADVHREGFRMGPLWGPTQKRS